MKFLKQSTASQSVLLGPFVDDTNGATAETGLTIANTDIRLSKAGGNMAAKNSGGGTHDELGYYTITLDATDSDTVGILQLVCKMSGALVVEETFYVLEESIYDAMFGSSAAGFDSNGRVDVGAWLGNAVTASSGNPDVNVESIDSAAITAASIDASALNGKGDWNTTTPLDADGIRSAVGLTAANLDTQFSTAQSDLDTLTGADGVTLATSQPNYAPNTATPPSAASIADAVLDEALSGHVTAGTLGKAIADTEADTDELQQDWANGGRLDTILDARASQTSVNTIDGNVDAILVDTGTTIPAQISGLENVSSSDVQTACNSALVALDLDHLFNSAAGTEVEDSSILARLVSKSATPTFSDFVNTTDSLQAIRDRGDASWITATGFSTHSAADVWTAGTRTLTDYSDGSGFSAIPWNASWDAQVQSEVADALTAYDPPTKAELDAGLGALNDVSVSDILTTQITESYAADGDAPTISQALMLIQQMLTEFSISGTTLTVKRLDGAATAITLTLDDGSSPTSITRTG